MRNVVLCCLDSVRKDAFDEFAPRLAARADLTYANCRAASSWSAPSYASMLTGDLAHVHGVTTHDKSLESIDPAETVIGDLPDHATFGVSTNVFAGSPYGFDRFFDRFVDVTEAHRFPDGLDPAAFRAERDASGVGEYLAFLRATVGHDHPVASVANGVVGALDTASESAPIPKLFDDGAKAVGRETERAATDVSEPFVGFAAFMEAHTPLRHVRGFDRSIHGADDRFTTDGHGVWELMDATEEFAEFLDTRRGLYGASIDYLDRVIAALVDRLQAVTDRETTVVITADHGENQGYPWEDGRVRHKSSLSEGLLHVPLLVVNPPDGYPTVEREYVSHLELRRLLAAFARDEVIDPTASRVVAEHVGMSAGPEPPENVTYWDRLMRAAYEGERKVVWDSLGECTAYDLDPQRPGWQARLDEERTPPEWAEEYFAEDADESKRRLRDAARGDAVDDAVQDRLEKLGYA